MIVLRILSFFLNLSLGVSVYSAQIETRVENNANSMLLVAQHVDDGEGGGGNTHTHKEDSRV